MSRIMRGATIARQIIADHLSNDLPMLIDEARVQWELEDWQLPKPLKYNSYDPLMVDQYPSVGSLVSRTSRWTRTDYEPDAAEQYEAIYAVRVFVWARTPMDPKTQKNELPEYDMSLRVRDDLLATIRGCLLRKPSFGHPEAVKMNEATLVEDYLDAIKGSDTSPRWMAGGVLSFDMQLNESNYQRKIGDADTITVEEGLLVP